MRATCYTYATPISSRNVDFLDPSYGFFAAPPFYAHIPICHRATFAPPRQWC